MGERESRETGATARSLNVVHYVERDVDAAAAVLAGAVERGVTAATGSPACVALLPTADDALAFCEALFTHRRGGDRPLVPVTSIARGQRALAAGAAAIAGSASHVAGLVAQSRLDLTQLHTLLLVWPEDVLGDDEQRSLLERVIGEVPRSAERVAVCASRSAELTRFLERSMWRAREVDHEVPAAPGAATALRVITAPPAERLRALRSLLDAFDPESAVLLAFTDEGEAAARDASSILGAGALIRVARGIPDQRARLAILFDDVPTVDALAQASDAADEVVAIVRPSRLRALQKVAPGTVPITWTGALANARSFHDSLRDEIRGYAGSGAHLPWIPIIEPLLEGLDAVEVAASALALLDRERRKAKRAAPTVPAPPVERSAREDAVRPRPARGADRPGRPERGHAEKRPWNPRGRPERDDRPARGKPGERRPRRGDDIERTPRAAREGREWSERGERLRNSRRGPRGGEDR